MQTVIVLYGPTEKQLKGTGKEGNYYELLKNPSISSGILSARGAYKIWVANIAIDRRNDTLYPDMTYSAGLGIYTVEVTCIDRDGSPMKPSDEGKLKPFPIPRPTSALSSETVPFTGTGFPGLNPVDFAHVVPVSINSGQTTKASMALNNQILGFTLDAEAGDTLDLNYERLKGNMNLGMVVLSSDNQVFFQASLVTSESLATRFTLPTAGEYTIGVFRIALVEPEKVEKTEFELTATLNLGK